MTVSISYNKNQTNSNKSISHVLFFSEKINILSAKKFVSKQEYDLIYNLIKGKDLKENFLTFDINSKKKNYLC